MSARAWTTSPTGSTPRARRLLDGLQAVLAQAGAAAGDVTYAFFGLPAYGEDGEVTAALDALPAAAPRSRPLPLRQ